MTTRSPMRPTPSRGGFWRSILALAAALWALCAPTLAFAYTPPPIQGHVTDTAGKLTPGEVLALDAKLSRVRKETGNEIAVFLLPSLGSDTIEDVAYATFNAWKVGQKGADNGILLVIAPGDRKVRIEAGKGVGGALPDLKANEIIRSKIGPLLKQDRFREGIDQGTDAIAEALKPVVAPTAPVVAPSAPLSVGGWIGLIVAGLVLFGIGAFVVFLVISAIRGFWQGIIGPYVPPSRSFGSSSSSSDWSSSSNSSSSSDWSSSSDSSFSGGGGESGGGGSSDSY